MNLVSKYIGDDLKPGLLQMYGAKTIMLIAGGFLGIFLPIFLFNLFDQSIIAVALYYGVSSLLYALTVPLGGQFLSKFGFRRSLRLSALWTVLFYVSFYFMDQETAIYLVPASMIFWVLFRLFYWLPYHVDMAKFTDDDDRGRQLGTLGVISNITAGLIPILSGFLLAHYGYDFVFIIAIILYLLSGLFYIKIPRTEEDFDWSYKDSWKEFFLKQNRRPVTSFVSDGMESLFGAVIWPIFIFQLLKGDFLEVGMISAFIIVITIILQITVGNYIDKKGNEVSLLKFGSFLYAFGWVVKIFILSSLHIFVAGVYHNVARIFSRAPFDVLTYDLAADQGHYVDEFTVLHEMAVHVGRVIGVIAVIVMSLFLSIQWTFLVAAFASVFMSFLREKHELVDVRRVNW